MRGFARAAGRRLASFVRRHEGNRDAATQQNCRTQLPHGARAVIAQEAPMDRRSFFRTAATGLLVVGRRANAAALPRVALVFSRRSTNQSST